MLLDRTVDPCYLKLHGGDEARFPGRIEIPHEERRGQRYGVAVIEEADIGIRRRFEAQCRV